MRLVLLPRFQASRMKSTPPSWGFKVLLFDSTASRPDVSKTSFHFGESAVADEGCGYADEGEEALGLAFVAAVQAPASGEPGHGPFDDPAVAPNTRRRLGDLASDAVPDPSLAEPSPQVIVVVALARGAWPAVDTAYPSIDTGPNPAQTPVRKSPSESGLRVDVRFIVGLG